MSFAPRSACVVLAIGAVTAVSPCLAQINPEVLKRYAGVWSSDCGNPRAPRVTISADALVFELGGKRVAAREPVSGYAMFGQMQPPEGFVVGFLSRKGGFNGYQSEQGDYLTNFESPQEAPIDTRAKLWNCDTQRREASIAFHSASVAAEAAAEAEDQARRRDPSRLHFAHDLMPIDPVFKRNYHAAIGRLRSDPWLSGLGGPSVPTYVKTIAGIDYRVMSTCKAHECDENNIVLLYDRDRGAVHGVLRWQGQPPMLVGNPSQPVAAALHKLMADTWRSER